MPQTAKTEIEAAVGKAVSNVATMRRRAGAKAAAAVVENTEQVEAAMAEGGQALQAAVDKAIDGSRALGRQSISGINEIGQVFAELADEQGRHGFETFRALVSTVDWDQAATIQGDFVRTSVERVLEFWRRYLDVLLTAQTAGVSLIGATAAKAAAPR